MWAEFFGHVIMLNFKNITVYGSFGIMQKQHFGSEERKRNCSCEMILYWVKQVSVLEESESDITEF